jgi:hypothetical protein
MTTDQFQATLHRTPFRPFMIRMADGRSFDVAHRDFVARFADGPDGDYFCKRESYSVLDLLLMSELEVHAGKGRNA